MDFGKSKAKGPVYKFQSDIETSIDLKRVLKEIILDAKIEFTLREALGIVKKDFHELIFDIIKRKRQMIAEAVMIHALDTHMTEEEEMEIGEVFALMVEPVAKSQEAKVDEKVEDDLGMTDDKEYEILQMFTKDNTIDIEGCVAKIESLAIYDDVVVKRLEGMDNLEDEVCSPISFDMKEGLVEHMALMATCKVRLEIIPLIVLLFAPWAESMERNQNMFNHFGQELL